MKRIFASLLAVMMIVACFAVSTSAAGGVTNLPDGAEVDVQLTVENAKPGATATITVAFTVDNPITTTDEPVIDWYMYFPADKMTYVPDSYKGVNCTTISDYNEEGMIGFSVFCDQAGEAVTAGTPYFVSLSADYVINAAAGETITLTDDGSLWDDGTTQQAALADVGLSEFTFTVEADEPAVVIGEAASKGAQIRAEKYDDVSDIRFAFTADEASAKIATVVYKITCNNKTITVNGNAASHDGLFKVVVENVPADYYAADFAVEFVVTYADGTVKTASDINNINAVAAA